MKSLHVPQIGRILVQILRRLIGDLVTSKSYTMMKVTPIGKVEGPEIENILIMITDKIDKDGTTIIAETE